VNRNNPARRVAQPAFLALSCVGAFAAHPAFAADGPDPTPANDDGDDQDRRHDIIINGQLIKADVGLEVAFADVGGWDTHVNQGGAQGQLAARLDDFARSVSALVADLGDRMADVVIMTMSEFGRTARQNGNGGTDHGHAGALFVIGGNVHGGKKVFGTWFRVFK